MDLNFNRSAYQGPTLPSYVKVVEVGPRDGLQNETREIATQCKIELINRLSDCGFTAIETGSLVSPQKVPQMRNSDEVYRGIDKQDRVDYCVLVGNRLGLDRAINMNTTAIAVFCAASETFSRKNNNCSIEKNLQCIQELCDIAANSGIKIRAYISCVLGCPYEGKVDAVRISYLAKTLYGFGCTEISLADTIGVGTPGLSKTLIDCVACDVPIENLAVHFHDTYGQALANVLATMELGVHIVDSAVAGLGGCNFAKGATGNLASEDLVYMLHGLNICTNINFERLVSTGWFIADCLQRDPASKVSLALRNASHSKSKPILDTNFSGPRSGRL